jgi:hypothetical protein
MWPKSEENQETRENYITRSFILIYLSTALGLKPGGCIFIFFKFIYTVGTADGGTVVKVLSYKSEGR